jgi:hypothetical protein
MQKYSQIEKSKLHKIETNLKPIRSQNRVSAKAEKIKYKIKIEFQARYLTKKLYLNLIILATKKMKIAKFSTYH